MNIFKQALAEAQAKAEAQAEHNRAVAQARAADLQAMIVDVEKHIDRRRREHKNPEYTERLVLQNPDIDLALWMTVDDAAQVLRVCGDTVRSYVTARELKAIQYKFPGGRWQNLVCKTGVNKLKKTVKVGLKKIQLSPGYLSLRQAAKQFDVPYGTLMGHLQRGTLPVHRHEGYWIIHEEDMRTWEQTVKGRRRKKNDASC